MNKKVVYKIISIVLLLIAIFSLFVAIFLEDTGSFIDLSMLIRVPAAIIALVCFILGVVLWKLSK